MFQKFILNLLTKLVIQISTQVSIILFHTTFQHNFPTKFVHLIVQPILANNVFNTIFINIFHHFLSHNFPIQLFQPNCQHNFPENFYELNLPHNFSPSFQLFFSLKSYTHLFTHFVNKFSRYFPYSLNTASQILCTEYLSSVIHTERGKVMQGVAVGLRKKLLYMGYTEYFNM